MDVDDSKNPKIVGEVSSGITAPQAIAVQFRYAFLTDRDGFKVLDITEPTSPKLLPNATVPLKSARRLYTALTYAYVANGPEGIAIIDIERPPAPRLRQMFNAGGKLRDTRAIQIGAVNASMFGLVADGSNGFHVLQLVSPENVPQYMGFAPPPNPKWIASYQTKGEAIAISRGLDRDRVVDESGNQTVVFGRRGARPFNLEEISAFFRPSSGASNSLYQVDDVTLVNGKLIRSSGENLSIPLPFPATAPQEQPRYRTRTRITRRGE